MTDFDERNNDLFTQRVALVEELAECRARIAHRQSRGKRAMATKIAADDRRAERRLARKLSRLDEEIVETNYGLVRSYVRRFTRHASRSHAGDYEAAARVGLMRAIDSFDPQLGRFGSWAYKPIMREVLRAVRDLEYPNLNPTDFERRPRILQAWQRLGSPVPVPFDDVAEAAEVTVEQVQRVLAAPVLESLGSPSGDDAGYSVGERLESLDRGVAEQVELAMDLESLERYGFAVLDDREHYVLTRRFGLDREPEQRLNSIGAQLGLSREAVRQIEAKALAKLGHPVVLRRLHRGD